MSIRNLIESTIEIDASPEEVWAVVSDLKRMGEWSPQCRRMIIRGGEVRNGTRTININSRGLLWWPTRSQVIEFVPNKRIAFKVLENHSIWTYELAPTATGTKLTESRATPTGTTKFSSFLVEKILGGTEDFETELEQGMAETLERIKREVETSRS